jgi:hypothetical protein
VNSTRHGSIVHVLADPFRQIKMFTTMAKLRRTYWRYPLHLQRQYSEVAAKSADSPFEPFSILRKFS